MTPRTLVSGPFRLDLIDERLWRGHETIPLGSRAFELLRVLMECPQTLLTKDELFDRVWPGVAVSESVLTTAIKDLRRALGDEARAPTVIKTVHGRGYRYLLPVAVGDDLPVGTPVPPAAAGSPRPQRTPWRTAVSAAAVLACVILMAVFGARILSGSGPAGAPVAEGAKSVAVLPFTDLSAGRDRAWFAGGLTEEVLNSLSRTPDLRVVSRQSSGRFRGGERDAATIGRQLGVAHVLEGTSRQSGERLRVTVKLVRTSDGEHIWSKTYDRRGQDVISIQEDIAFDIARALKTVMEPGKLRAMTEAGTRSVEAYEAYLKGLALDQRQMAEGDVRLALAAGEAYEQARTLDPGFSAAHWRAAHTWFGNATRIDAGIRGHVDEAERMRRYLERIDRAIATSRDDVEKLKYAAAAAAIQLRFKTAHRLMTRYLDARPRDVDAWEEMGDLAAYAGEPAWTAKASERVHALSMQDGLPRSRAITLSVMAEDYPAAARRAQEQLAQRPDDAVTQYQTHRALIFTGQPEAARALLTSIASSSLPASNRWLAGMRQACADGRRDEAAALRAKIDAAGSLGPRWQAAQIMSDARGAEALLRPYDGAGRLPTLMQFMIYPTFDARPFPALSARLTQEGVRRPAPVATPYACA